LRLQLVVSNPGPAPVPGAAVAHVVRPTKNPLAGGTGGCGRTRCGVRRQV